MILYKYASYEAGLKIIESNSIGFSQPNFFNDPFELQASYPSKRGENPIEVFLNSISTWAKKDIWAQNTGVLSLTRAPLNPLMWAHYSAQHSGFVIGIDASIKELTCEKTNFIPVQYGSVIYTNSKPDADFISKPSEAIEVGGTFHFPYGQLERLQRMFLFKPMCWSYEEEVRVVKCLKGIESSTNLISGNFKIIEVADRPIYLLDLPIGTIKEIYLGVRNKDLEQKRLLAFKKKLSTLHPSVKIFGCKISSKTWNLEALQLNDN